MMSDRWQMVSTNGGFVTPTTVRLSTVEMPSIPGLDLGYRYESCVFAGHDAEVVERYDLITEAISGHERWRKRLGL